MCYIACILSLSVGKQGDFMRKIAITGVMGAGKSTVGQILVRHGLPFISADALNREAIKPPEGPAYKPLFQLLGPGFISENGLFDTRKIARRAFRDPKMLQDIESLLHPIIWDLMKKKEKTGPFLKKNLLFYEIPLLFEKKWERFFSVRVLIALDPTKQISRLQQNRNLSLGEIEDRIRFQGTQAEKAKKADYVIWNNGTLGELEKEIQSLINKLSSKKGPWESKKEVKYGIDGFYPAGRQKPAV